MIISHEPCTENTNTPRQEHWTPVTDVLNMESLTDRENTLFRRWSRKRKLPFMSDGVPYPDAFKKSPVRVVFVLREANHRGQPKREDLRVHLVTTEHPFWIRKMSLWCHGLTHHTLSVRKSWNQTQSDDFVALNALRPFGFVQIKKVPGGTVANHRDVRRYAEEDAPFLRRQLSIYSPDVIVACGLSPGNIFDALLDTAFDQSEKTVWGVGGKSRRRYAEVKDIEISKRPFYLIESYHPSSRGRRVDAYKDLLTSYRRVIERRSGRRSC